MKRFFIKIIFLLTIFYTNIQLADEILIYADSITYDSEKNIIAKGNVKIINENEIITTELVIYNKSQQQYILPKRFKFKDEKNNYYYGKSGNFSKNFKEAQIDEIKLRLNDGSRIVGKSSIRNDKIDIINKGTYSPCISRIKINNFVCPIWQLEGEKILHDSEKLFLYQKHAKMRIFNIPVFYLPYFAVPSPLRKKRKSGFLTPSINFNFLDTKVSQSTSFPYYFNLDIDKELTLTPFFNYGGGINSSQRFLFDYNQLLSGGNLDVDLSIDTTLENENNEAWFKDGSIVTSYNQNINENYKIKIDSALQTSRDYIKTTDPNNPLSYNTSLSSSLNLKGYTLIKDNDSLSLRLAAYQVIAGNEDNKTTPTVFPFINYTSGEETFKNIKYNNRYQLYNIFRDKGTTEHSQSQKKISLNSSLDTEIYSFKSKINFKSEIHNQYFITENKKIDNQDFSSETYRFFPMAGIFIETPFRHIKTNTFITPKYSVIINSSQSNSNKISNEESTNNSYTISNQRNLNRYDGTDKLDNSKRMNYGFNVTKSKFSMNFSQNYEFDPESDFNKVIGNNYHLSDALLESSYIDENNDVKYQLRYDPHQDYYKKQGLSISNKNIIGVIGAAYINENQETNNILDSHNEVFNIDFKSKKFMKYSKFNFNGNYDLISDSPNEFTFGYSYFDECFGINLDYRRGFYTDNSLKPQDTLTLMFSFKNLGSYKSTNLAVDHRQRQDIKWENYSVSNEMFN